MPDREKVIKGLECLAQKQAPTANPCKDCGYINRPSFAICVKDIASDALELLKEQEAETGHWVLDDDDTNTWECSECGSLQTIFDGTPIDNSWFFCPHCGAKLEGR